MKPQLVLHICCAPDEAYVVKVLRETYDLLCFFCNPNIAPAEEYLLRLDEACRTAKFFGVPFVADHYDPDSWKKAIKNLEETPEGGERCRQCFLLRLRRTAQFCKSRAINSFTTVMSVSPHKRISMLNETGHSVAGENGLSYEPFDFKKKDGFRKSIELSKELDLYRQDYCGCRLSRTERDRRLASRVQVL